MHPPPAIDFVHAGHEQGPSRNTVSMDKSEFSTVKQRPQDIAQNTKPFVGILGLGEIGEQFFALGSLWLTRQRGQEQCVQSLLVREERALIDFNRPLLFKSVASWTTVPCINVKGLRNSGLIIGPITRRPYGIVQ